MRLSRFVVALAAVVLFGSIGAGTATAAPAGKPERLAVQITAPVGGAYSPGQYTFTVNTAARQIATVSVTIDGDAVASPVLQPVSNKLTEGSGSFTLADGEHTLQVTVTTKRGETVSDTEVFQSLSSKPVDVEGAKAWCAGVSGTWEEGQDYFLGTDETGTVQYWAYDAVWACLQASTDWTLATGQPFVQDINTKYCSESPLQIPYLTLYAGFDPSKNPDLDNFICFRQAA